MSVMSLEMPEEPEGFGLPEGAEQPYLITDEQMPKPSRHHTDLPLR